MVGTIQKKKVIIMFTYIQIFSNDTVDFKGYAYYEFIQNNLSLTLSRGVRPLKRTIIPLDKILCLNIEKFYGEDLIRFIYNKKIFSFINTGYGESLYLENHISKTIN